MTFKFRIEPKGGRKMEENKKETAQEVPVQEQSNIFISEDNI
jgi:hypothetical protein